MQLAKIVLSLIVMGSIGFSLAQCDDYAATVSSDISLTNTNTSTDQNTDFTVHDESCADEDGQGLSADDQGCSMSGDDEDEEDVWLPVFAPFDVVPSYQEIAERVDANEALFDTAKATVDTAFKAALRQCIIDGALDEEKLAPLMEPIKRVYMTFVREVAFLAYAKAERLKSEDDYQSYKAQVEALQASIQELAHQASDSWFAVEESDDTTAHALAVSQYAAATIDVQQAQVAQLQALITAFLANVAIQL